MPEGDHDDLFTDDDREWLKEQMNKLQAPTLSELGAASEERRALLAAELGVHESNLEGSPTAAPFIIRRMHDYGAAPDLVEEALLASDYENPEAIVEEFQEALDEDEDVD